MIRILVMLIAGMLLCSCSPYQVSKDDELTARETEEIIAFVRRFLLHSKIKFSASERNAIQKEKPEVRVTYTGYKRGTIVLRWQINGRLLRVSNSGKLLSNTKSDWEVRVVTDPTAGKLPSHFFGAHGEDLSLPPL